MTSPSISNPDITIFEDLYESLPNLDLLPLVGCFEVRLMEKGFHIDQKLDPVNQAGIFLGFATHDGVYGSQILTPNHTIDTAKNQVAYDNNLMPLVSSDASNPRMKSLMQFLRRGSHFCQSPGIQELKTSDVSDHPLRASKRVGVSGLAAWHLGLRPPLP